jgi:hypothetical protein
MKRIFVAIVAGLAIVLTVFLPAWAKSPTVKLRISGGSLASAIDIREPSILHISNVWSGEFIDNSQSVAKGPPEELPRYEVSFYTETANNSVMRRYVLYYSPNPKGGQGFIYLPGEGETWYGLNVSAILRNGRDGRWNYASPKWENLIKPLIAQAGTETGKH